MEWKHFSMEWNGRFLTMEWKILKDMENFYLIPIHSMPCSWLDT